MILRDCVQIEEIRKYLRILVNDDLLKRINKQTKNRETRKGPIYNRSVLLHFTRDKSMSVLNRHLIFIQGSY